MTSSRSEIKAFDAWKIAVLASIIFAGLIWIIGPNLNRYLVTLLPDQGASWYYWKLPSRNPTSMLIVWTLYLLHQTGAWAGIYWAQRNLTGKTP